MPDLPDRVRLVVLFGGRSAEHEVSCISAGSVLGAVDRDRYEVTAVGITKEGRWVLAEDGPPPLVPDGPEIDPLKAVALGDVVFPILHGPLGEDGTVQGLLEVAGVPYVGCGVLASALAMDKAAAKLVLAAAGIPQVPSVAIRHGLGGSVSDDLGWPRFVKPANMGSSVGVSKVQSVAELASAMEQAFLYDEWVVVEHGVTAREVECAVLGGLEPQATALGEIVPKAEFYDYDDKYSGQGADLFVPADLPESVHEEGRRLAIAAFQSLRCDGLARVDFFYEEGGRGLLLNEVNTMPGFTPYSMYPQLWAHAGVSYPALIDRLVALALERHDRRSAHTGRTR
ncbi:MAG: ddl [Actinomycetia bacterium]|nr:ddl [Actinomycetes bacterium]